MKTRVFENFSYTDSRGEFNRIYDKDVEGLRGIQLQQINISKNPKIGTLRGMHFQCSGPAEHKFITVLNGAIRLVVSNAHLVKTKSQVNNEYFDLDENSKFTLMVPSGLATGWLSLSDNVFISYLMTARFQECRFSGFRFNDPFADINWPFLPKVMSQKDLLWPNLV